MKPIRNGKSDRQRADERHSRNRDPHAAAMAATWIFGERYAGRLGGSMDFWDTLDGVERSVARECAKKIREARPERIEEREAAHVR